MKRILTLLAKIAMILLAVGVCFFGYLYRQELGRFLAEFWRAPLIEISTYPEIGKAIIITNKTDIAKLSWKFPFWYFLMSEESNPHERPHNTPFVAVAYPVHPLTRMKNGVYVSNVLFVYSDGFVGHGRGGMRDMKLFGCRLPGYRDTLYSLCHKYGLVIPTNSVSNKPPDGTR